MTKFIILIPVYNDWKSVFKLIENIDLQINNEIINILIINDASTEIYDGDKKKYLKIYGYNQLLVMLVDLLEQL